MNFLDLLPKRAHESDHVQSSPGTLSPRVPTRLTQLGARLVTYRKGDPRELSFECPCHKGHRISCWTSNDRATVENITIEPFVNTNHLMMNQKDPGRVSFRDCGLFVHINKGVLT